MTRLVPFALAALTLAVAARAEEIVPLDKQKGVRGRIVVAPELLSTPVKLAAAREKALRGAAIARRPLGHAITPITEPPPALVVMLEGDGIPRDAAEPPSLRVTGRRFLPGGLVLPRIGPLRIKNEQKEPITVVDEAGGVVAKIPAGGAVDAQLRPGEHMLSVAEMPYATASLKVLERGRILPLVDGEIPLVEIPGGEYQLSFYFGSEPLRVQPLQIPEQGLVFIDATVSALKVVEVSVKDASMRVAVPPSSTLKEDGAP
jgi:hypothetical protein